jgi:serine/threonine-protein kinase
MKFPAPSGTTFLAPLGVGSVALVARVERGPEELACKRLLPQHRDRAGARLSLVREARALALARHPALPALRGVGSDEAGPYVLETIVEGLSLRDVKGRWGGRVPWHLATHVAREAARVVSELHALKDEAGLIHLAHGDLGPDNLRLGPYGEVAVIDLGNARFRGFTADLESGERGTAPYLAPELARGEQGGTQATDVYALCATVAWLLLDGEAALGAAAGEAARLLEAGERGIPASRLAPLPTPLRTVLERMLAFDPSRRVSDLGPLLTALDGLR